MVEAFAEQDVLSDRGLLRKASRQLMVNYLYFVEELDKQSLVFRIVLEVIFFVLHYEE